MYGQQVPYGATSSLLLIGMVVDNLVDTRAPTPSPGGRPYGRMHVSRVFESPVGTALLLRTAICEEITDFYPKTHSHPLI